MGSAVMHRTKGRKICGHVLAAFGTQLDVVEIEKRCIFAAWSLTALVVSSEHRSAQGRGDGLFGPCSCPWHR